MTSSLAEFDPMIKRVAAEALLEGAAMADIIECLTDATGLGAEQVGDLLTLLREESSFKAAQILATRLRCREWSLRAYATLASQSGRDGLDERAAITGDEFLSGYYFSNRPLLLRGIAASWPATTGWSPDYLKRQAGQVQVEVMVNRANARACHQNTAQDLRTRVSFAEFIDRVFSGEVSNDYYLVSRNRFFAEPEALVLLADLAPPDFIRISDPGDSVRMWFGPKGTLTKLHYDDRNVLLVQIRGGKAVTLYAPYYSYAMKQEMPWYTAADPQEDSGEIPRPRRIDVRLDPGDALFIPVGWWHEIASLDPSISLTFKEFSVANEYGQP